MAAKYFYQFYGTDHVLNRVEIHDNSTVTVKEVTGASEPFKIDYEQAEKFQAVRGSGATLNLISKSNFQFIDLHTDDMQKYLIKFYRAGSLYWIGWLDSELYTETLTNAIPYPVEFTAADFNILERLKYLKDEETKYSDITTLLTQLKRCFDKLNLPFGKLYIGCTTSITDVTLATNETILHKLYIQSSNFYDEDGEACKCDEVVKSILEPFGLMMVQHNADVYIYDYNTVKNNGSMSCYDFATLSYISKAPVNFLLGDIDALGISGTESSLGFEEMINNVKITCSLYGSLGKDSEEKEVTADNVSDLIESGGDVREYTKKIYAKCDNWFNDYRYIVFTLVDFGTWYDRKDDKIVGADFKKNDTDEIKTIYTIPVNNYLFSSETNKLKLNAKDNPLAKDRATRLIVKAKIYTTDNSGNIIKVHQYATGPTSSSSWTDYDGGTIPETSLWFLSSDINTASTVLNTWSSLRNIYGYINGSSGRATLSSDEGFLIPLSGCNGNIVVEITNSYSIFHKDFQNNGAFQEWGYTILSVFHKYYPKDMLLNNISFDIVDSSGDSINVPDVEFSSYVNTKVKTDLDEKKIIVCSANEDEYPVSKGSLLVSDSTELFNCQLSYTRSGQTDILERLLMCSLHSNFSSKRRTIQIDIKGCANPALRKVTYNNLFTSDFMVMGCSIDFENSKTTLIGSEYSEDTAKLSDIKYV